MRKRLTILITFIIITGMINVASAHKSQAVGNYNIEISWEQEPPIIGKENAITIMITHSSNDEGVSGLESLLEASITLNDEMFVLELTESENMQGLYVAGFTPSSTGYPILHLTGTLDHEVFEVDFHPDEIMKKCASPLQQQKKGIRPSEIQCSEGKTLLFKVSDGTAICVTPNTADVLITRNWATYI